MQIAFRESALHIICLPMGVPWCNDAANREDSFLWHATQKTIADTVACRPLHRGQNNTLINDIDRFAEEVLSHIDLDTSPEQALMEQITNISEKEPFDNESSKALSLFLLQQLSFRIQRGTVCDKVVEKKAVAFLARHGFHLPKKPNIFHKVIQRLNSKTFGKYLLRRSAEHFSLSMDLLKKNRIKLSVAIILALWIIVSLVTKRRKVGWFLLIVFLLFIFFPEMSQEKYNRQLAEKYFSEQEFQWVSHHSQDCFPSIYSLKKR